MLKYIKKRGNFMTTKTKELISMVESLPVDIKTKLVEKILESLYPSQKEIDALWVKEAEKRVKEIKTGKVKPVSGDKVFKEIQGKFYK
jgi:putative addiction module component (TIGR02574 family)